MARMVCAQRCCYALAVLVLDVLNISVSDLLLQLHLDRRSRRPLRAAFQCQNVIFCHTALGREHPDLVHFDTN